MTLRRQRKDHAVIAAVNDYSAGLAVLIIAVDAAETLECHEIPLR